ncbi:hypothetical protein MTO96_034421 [Rhipicephalus appendiculatus]
MNDFVSMQNLYFGGAIYFEEAGMFSVQGHALDLGQAHGWDLKCLSRDLCFLGRLAWLANSLAWRKS